MDKEASTSGVRVYFTIPFVTPSLGGDYDLSLP